MIPFKTHLLVLVGALCAISAFGDSLEDIVDRAFAGHWKYGFSEKTSLMTPGWTFDAAERSVLDNAIRVRKGWPTFAVTHFFAAYWRLAALESTKGRVSEF